MGANGVIFTGEFYYHLDAKNRLVIPGKIRDSVNVKEEGEGWYLVPGYDGAISLFTPATFERLANREKAELFRLKNVRDYDRLHFALSAHAEADRLGRLLVPEVMLRRTGIGRDVCIVGVRDHIEVWDKAKWEAFVGQNFAAYDEMARNAFEAEREDGRRPTSS
jgi:MraZ protein